MGQKVKIEHLTDKLNIKDLIEFLEYEEALTKDKDTASRIATLLINLNIWSDDNHRK